jgi:hypothetical protein
VRLEQLDRIGRLKTFAPTTQSNIGPRESLRIKHCDQRQEQYYWSCHLSSSFRKEKVKEKKKWCFFSSEIYVVFFEHLEQIQATIFVFHCIFGKKEKIFFFLIVDVTHKKANRRQHTVVIWRWHDTSMENDFSLYILFAIYAWLTVSFCFSTECLHNVSTFFFSFSIATNDRINIRSKLASRS